MKLSDLNPSLGIPTSAGPCLVVERIEDTVRSPRQRDDLEMKVEQGESLSNPDAAAVYKPMTERGPGGMVKKIELTSHAQYRMDLRGITIPDIRFGLQAFQKDLSDWKSRRSPEYQSVARAIERRETIEYLYSKWDLFLAFTFPSVGVARIVTVYWKGVSDPRAPGTCVVPHTHKHGGYRAPVDNWTPQTYRKDPGSTPDNQEKQQVLPAPNGGKTKDLGPQTFNGPGPSGTGPGGRSVHKDMARTKAQPGGDHPTPPARTSPARRPEVNAATKGKPYPGADRQRDQRGHAKRYFKVRYQQKRNEYKLRANKWYKKYRKNPRYLKDQERRTKSPERFERRPGGGVAENKDRSKKNREQNKKKASANAPVFYLPTGQWGVFVGVCEDSQGEPQVRLHLEDAVVVNHPVDEFFDVVETGEEAAGEIFDALDAYFEWQDSEEGAVERLASLWMIRRAEMLYQKHPPRMDSDTVYDRAEDRKDRKDQKSPLEKKDAPVVEQNPGSAKVIPWNNPDLVNNKGAMSRVATRIHEIVGRCGAEVRERAAGLKPKLVRVDQKNAMWLFDVPGSKSPYRVRVKATRKGNILDVAKLDVHVSCNCPYWQWQGPEHHAKQSGYLFGSPTGTASKPTVKDPDESHTACKHVVAVFNHITTRGWRVPMSKLGAEMFFQDTLSDSDFENRVRMLAARYLAEKGD